MSTKHARRIAKKDAKSKAKKSKSNTKRIPRQNPLPGMEDAKLVAIENAALDYAEIRDQRQELTTQEVDLKKKLLDLMHKHEKTEYKRNGISVIVKMEEETVKVRVREEADFPAAKSEPDVEVETPEEETAEVA